MNKKIIIGFAVLFILQSIIIYMLVSFMQTRPMLEARKIIQVNNAKAIDRLGVYTPVQRCEMKEAWKYAEYLNEPNIFADAVCE